MSDSPLDTDPRHMLRGTKQMAEQSHKHPSRGKMHKDWRAWIAFLLMLVAIITDVLTLDDSIIPR
jgi:hypothetical protein